MTIPDGTALPRIPPRKWSLSCLSPERHQACGGLRPDDLRRVRQGLHELRGLHADDEAEGLEADAALGATHAGELYYLILYSSIVYYSIQYYIIV